MAHWPLPTRPLRGVRTTRSGSAPATTTVTAPAVVNTKSATYTDLVASTPDEASLAVVWVSNTFVSGADSSVLLDLVFGSSLNEKPIIENLGCGFQAAFSVTTGPSPACWMLPVRIPPASRLAARIQSSIASKAAAIAVDLYGGGAGWAGGEPFTSTDLIFADTATSRGKVLTAGAANVKGAWTVMTASSANPYSGFILGLQPNGRVVTTAEHWSVDIAIGSDASPEIVVPDYYARYLNIEIVNYGFPTVYPLANMIPAGSRIIARVANSTASVTTDLTLHGVRA